MTPSQIATVVGIINSSNAAVGRAMVILLSYQTEGERNIGTTVESNGVGFSGATDVNGTYFAKWVLGLPQNTSPRHMAVTIERFLKGNSSGRALTGRFLVRAREIATLHRRQLVDLLPKVQPDYDAVNAARFREQAAWLVPVTVRSGDPSDARLNRSFDELPPTVRYGDGV